MEIPKRTTSSLGRSASLCSQIVRAVLRGPARTPGNMNEIMVWAWMHWLPYALGLGMDALVTLCSWNTNGLMVWAWMHWLLAALGTRTDFWFGHGCTGCRTLLEHERNYGLRMDALVTVCSWNANGFMVWAWMHWLLATYAFGTRTELWFEHGRTGYRMLLEHEWNYGLGMNALVTVCSRNMNGIMVWASMHWLPYALGTRTEIWFGRGCTAYRMLLEHERNYMVWAWMHWLTVIVCSWNTNGIMV